MAGTYRRGDGTGFIASLTDSSLIGRESAGAERGAAVAPIGGAGAAWTWLFALAFMLLLVEWFLFRTERIP